MAAFGSLELLSTAHCMPAWFPLVWLRWKPERGGLAREALVAPNKRTKGVQLGAGRKRIALAFHRAAAALETKSERVRDSIGRQTKWSQPILWLSGAV
jgi:hypothetical protein